MGLSDEIAHIRRDLDMLLKLYARLVDKIAPEEEPTPEDIEAIRDEDDVAGEDELMRTLE